MRQKKLKPSETSKVIADEVRRAMAKADAKKLTDSYFDNMEDFIVLCKKMTAKQIERRNMAKTYLGDVDEIVQQICYVMLKNELTRESFDGKGKSMYSYVHTLILSCLTRLSWGRDKYGDGYVLA